jgi:putative protein-disulfide isomerase
MTAGTIRDLAFVYVGDPMCSWCWGFAPVLEHLEGHYEIPIHTVVGGLRPGPSAEPLEHIRDYLAHHWHQVEERSGQPFDHAALSRAGWTYDTELPCTAVVVMRSLNERETLRFFTRLQRAFYAENVDITDPAAYPDLLEGFDVDHAQFAELLTTAEMKRAAWEDFEEARSLSATGFPTLLLRRPDGYAVVTRGYVPWEPLRAGLDRWLEAEYGAEVAAGVVCSLDGEGC